MQAIKHPHLTPQSSLRTSVLACFESTAAVSLPALRAIRTERFVGCSSVHGVGPCVGLVSLIFDGCLQYTLVFPTPLFSREQVRQVRESMHALLKEGVFSENGDTGTAHDS